MMVQNEPLVSIIVPIYNSQDYIVNCLKSIQNQSINDYEVILINDGSKDRSESIALEYVSSDSRFSLINQENKGVSEARNVGLKNAHGKYILFVDSDDEIREDYLEKLVSALCLKTNRLVICDYYQDDGSNNQKEDNHHYIDQGIYTRKEYIKHISRNPGTHYIGVLWNKIYIRELIRKGNIHFKETLSLGEDFAFNMDYLSMIDEIYCIPERLYVYGSNHPESLCNREKDQALFVKERNQLYQKYCGLYKREKLDKIWFYRMHFFVIKVYFDQMDMLKNLTDSANGNDTNSIVYSWHRYLSKEWVNKNGICTIEFIIYRFVRKIKRFRDVIITYKNKV